MDESLWLSLDQYLCDYLWEKLGPDGDYTDNLIKDAFTTIVQDISDFETRPKPSLAVSGRDLLPDIAEHGDGDVHYDSKMPYIIAIVTEGDQESAVAQAKTLIARLQRAIRELVITLNTSDDGEAFNIITVGNSRLTKYKKKPDIKSGRNFVSEDNYYVLAATALLAESTV